MDQIKLAVLFQGMAQQWAQASSSCRNAETVMLDGCGQNAVGSLQGLDVLMQELEQMSALCLRLSRQSDVQRVTIASHEIEQVTLEHLRGMLKGHPVAPFAAADVELF